jgi:hypothetical protein
LILRFTKLVIKNITSMSNLGFKTEWVSFTTKNLTSYLNSLYMKILFIV